VNCPVCGTSNSDAQKFCGDCGARLGTAEARPDFPEGRNYTPPHLAEKILKSRNALEGERKPVTVMFCDIADSTGLAERIGAERMHHVLNAFFEAALAEVHRFEGTVNQFLGDGFMALFGAPVAHEDHARRAVLAAIAIRRAISNDAFAARDAGLQLRMGLNSGAVVVGSIGDNLRMDYTAVGDTTNVAARIQALAKPGTILVSEAVWRATQEHVQCRALGERTLKGKAEAVALYELIRAHTVQGAHRHAGAVGEALFGRQAEVAEIGQALQRLKSGTGGVIGIIGEAGLGKSRLMEEARSLARELGLRWLQGDCLSFGRTLSYWSFREVIRRGFGIDETDDEAQSWLKVESGMRALFDEQADELLPYIGTLLAVTLPEPLAQHVDALDSLAIGHQIFRATLLTMERSAQQRAVVVAFEDWHWADVSSGALLEHLLPLADRVPILFVVSSRPEAQGPAESFRQVTAKADPPPVNARTLRLTPLSGGDSVQLAERLLGGGAIPATVRDMLLNRAEGNPFYLSELAHTLLATHSVERDAASGDWRTTSQFGTVPLPETIEGLILARIDRLEDEAKQVLKAAAVVGRTFFYRILKAITDAGSALDDDLVKLRRAELIDEKQLAPELEYVFRHPLIQQATYDSLLQDRRRQMHARVGQCIEQLFEDRLEPFYAMLAYHFAKAEDWIKGLEYLFKAAERADRLAADEEALTLYHATIETAERHGVKELDAVKRAQLDGKIGEAHFRAGRNAEARTQFVAALRRLRQEQPGTKLRMGLSVAAGLFRFLLERPDGPRDAQASMPMQGDVALACQVWNRLAWIDFFAADPLTFTYDILQVTRLSRHYRDSKWHVIGLALIAVVFDAMSMYRTALSLHSRALTLAQRVADQSTLAHTMFYRAMHCHAAGRWREGLPYYDRAKALSWEIGEIRLWAALTANLVQHLYSLGEPSWLGLPEQILRVAVETSDDQARAWALSMTAIKEEHAGQHDAALASLQKAMKVYEAIPDYRFLANALGLQCANLVELQRMDEGLLCAMRAEHLIRSHSLRGTWCTRPLMALAEVRLAVFERSRLHRAETASAVRRMRRQGREVRDEGAVECHRIEGEFAWLRGRHERALACWDRGLAEAETLGARHAKARILFERGRRTGRRADLEQAATLFEQCAATGELLKLQAHRNPGGGLAPV
jgi:class 3 adenylate cyclase/tetratricopeptide (TPR) repeat protein